MALEKTLVLVIRLIDVIVLVQITWEELVVGLDFECLSKCNVSVLGQKSALDIFGMEFVSPEFTSHVLVC